MPIHDFDSWLGSETATCASWRGSQATIRTPGGTAGPRVASEI